MRPSGFGDILKQRQSTEVGHQLIHGRESIAKAFEKIDFTSNQLYQFLQQEFGAQLGEKFSQNTSLSKENYLAYVVHFLDEKDILTNEKLQFWSKLSLQFNVGMAKTAELFGIASELKALRQKRSASHESRYNIYTLLNPQSRASDSDEHLPSLEDYTDEAMAARRMKEIRDLVGSVVFDQYKHAGVGFLFGKKEYDFSPYSNYSSGSDSYSGRRDHFRYEESRSSQSQKGAKSESSDSNRVRSSKQQARNKSHSSQNSEGSWSKSKPSPSEGYYETLGLDTNEMAGLSSEQAAKKVKRAYRKKVATNHPDRFQGAEKLRKQEEMKQANLAREALMKKYGAA